MACRVPVSSASAPVMPPYFVPTAAVLAVHSAKDCVARPSLPPFYTHAARLFRQQPSLPPARILCFIAALCRLTLRCVVPPTFLSRTRCTPPCGQVCRQLCCILPTVPLHLLHRSLRPCTSSFVNRFTTARRLSQPRPGVYKSQGSMASGFAPNTRALSASVRRCPCGCNERSRRLLRGKCISVLPGPAACAQPTVLQHTIRFHMTFKRHQR